MTRTLPIGASLACSISAILLLHAAPAVLQRDLAYDLPTMPFEMAEELARHFVSFFANGAAFLTNG